MRGEWHVNTCHLEARSGILTTVEEGTTWFREYQLNVFGSFGRDERSALKYVEHVEGTQSWLSLGTDGLDAIAKRRVAPRSSPISHYTTT